MITRKEFDDTVIIRLRWPFNKKAAWEIKLQNIDFFKKNFSRSDYTIKLMNSRSAINIYEYNDNRTPVKKIKLSRRETIYSYDGFSTPSEAIEHWLLNGESIDLSILQKLPEYKKLTNSTLKLVSTDRQLKNLTFVFTAKPPWIEEEKTVEIYRSGNIYGGDDADWRSYKKPKSFDRNSIRGWKSAFDFTYVFMEESGVRLHHNNPEAIEKAAKLGLL